MSREPELPAPPREVPPSSLRARVLEEAAGRKPAKRPLSPVLAAAPALIWLALLAVVHGQRGNWGTIGAVAAWGGLAAIAVMAALAMRVAASVGALGLGPKVSRALWSLAFPVLAGAAAICLVPNIQPAGDVLAPALTCDAWELLSGVPVLLLLVLVHRGRPLTAAWLVGAVSGVASATWGHAVLHCVCSWTDPIHIVFGHILPALPLAGLGAWLAERQNRTSMVRDERSSRR